MVKNAKIGYNLSLWIKVSPIFRLYQKTTPTICLILHQINLYVLFICGKKLVTIEIFLLNFFGESKCVTEWQFLLIFLKGVEKDPFLRPQMRAKETFSWWGFRDSIRNIPALKFNKKWYKSLEYFIGKDEILVKLWFKGLNYHNFHIFTITNFKTDRYLNNC